MSGKTLNYIIMKLKTILEAYRSGERGLPTYAELVEIDAALRAQADAQPVAWEHTDCTGSHISKRPPVSFCPGSLSEMEVKVTPLYIHPAPEAAQALSPDWLWGRLMDYCKKRGIAPANANELFAIVTEARELTRASAATTPKAQPVGQDVIDAITRYGDARADGGNSAEAIGEVIRLLRASAASVAEPSEWKCIRRDVACKLADRIIADYLLHYDFPAQGQSHMHDCITSVLAAAMTEAPEKAAQHQAKPSTDRLAYEGAREDLLDWKRRALEAEELNRKFIASVNGPTHMGEPVIAGQQQAEPVGDSLDARLRDALRGLGNIIADPMWADHAEVSKACLKYWHKTMHEARQTLRATKDGQRAGVTKDAARYQRIRELWFEWGMHNINTPLGAALNALANVADRESLDAVLDSINAAAPTPAAQGGV